MRSNECPFYMLVVTKQKNAAMVQEKCVIRQKNAAVAQAKKPILTSLSLAMCVPEKGCDSVGKKTFTAPLCRSPENELFGTT